MWPPLPISASRRTGRRVAKVDATSPPKEKPPRSTGVSAPISMSSVPPSAFSNGSIGA